MFYIKTTAPCGESAVTAITLNNVFTCCSLCGCEFHVNLEDALGDGFCDLENTTFTCGNCEGEDGTQER
ncbi:hypothetical protein FACS18948_4570 [Clostridia bacterium]|nr:hypothetical protein FACS18948_4570 [Clostridia bacterium]